MAPHKRGPWSQEEDDQLLNLVNTQGPHYWVRISQLLGTRSPKQCRERFHQNLKPSLRHTPISPEEGMLIERLVAEMGKRWADIARRLDGRSDNAVKNWWNGGMNRRRRMVIRHPAYATSASASAAAAARAHTGDQPERKPPPSSFSFATPIKPEREWEPARERAPASASIRTTILSAPARRYGDAFLISPSIFSERSAESAPSLISDSGSLPSVSPCVSSCPPLELLPLPTCLAAGRPTADGRRASLPALRMGSAGAYSSALLSASALAVPSSAALSLPEAPESGHPSPFGWPPPPPDTWKRKRLEEPHTLPPSSYAPSQLLPPLALPSPSSPGSAFDPLSPGARSTPSSAGVRLPSFQSLAGALVEYSEPGVPPPAAPVEHSEPVVPLPAAPVEQSEPVVPLAAVPVEHSEPVVPLPAAPVEHSEPVRDDRMQVAHLLR
ncbi:MAG: hypothetical protein M1826_007343 [Phylliscum demangeonii]|nr:MAG: hypothetical protein M1826_007343 [Phylliscum demangeonii]